MTGYSPVKLHLYLVISLEPVEVFMRLLQSIEDGNIASDLGDCESKRQTDPTSTASYHNDSALQREKILDRPVKVSVSVALENLLWLYYGAHVYFWSCSVTIVERTEGLKVTSYNIENVAGRMGFFIRVE